MVKLTENQPKLSTYTMLRANPSFARMAVSQSLNGFGASIVPIALAFALLEQGQGFGGLAIVLVSTSLGPVLATVFGGVAADSGNRAKIIMASRVLSGCLLLLLGALILLGLTMPWLLAIINFLIGCVTSFTMPASRAVVRDLVPPEDLQRGVALMSLSIDSVRLAGPGAAALLLTLIPNGAVIMVSAVASVLSALFIIGISLPPLPASGDNKLRQIGEGFNFALGQRWLVSSATCGLFVTGAWMAGFSLIGPVQAHASYDGSTFWGICGVFYTAGLIVGGIAALHARVRNPIIGCILASSGLALPLTALALTTPALVVYSSLFVASCLLSLAMTWWSTGVSLIVEKRFLARAFAFNSVVELAGIPLAYLVFGIVGSRYGISPESMQLTLVVIIVLASAINLFALRSFVFSPRIFTDPPTPAVAPMGRTRR